MEQYELEKYTIEVTASGKSTKSPSAKTRVEHSKIIGIFALLKGGSQANFQSLMSINVQGENLISDEKFHPFIIEKTNSLSVKDSMWLVDKDIHNSDVKIEYIDGEQEIVKGDLTLVR